MTSDILLKELRKKGYKLTEARRAVVEIVAQSPCALSPADVYELAKERYPTLGLVTVYRTLEKLEELHLVQRVHQDDGCNAYLPEAEGHKHLLICKECKKAVYFEGDDLDDFFDEVGKKHHFVVNDHWLQLFGICENCKKTPFAISGANLSVL